MTPDDDSTAAPDTGSGFAAGLALGAAPTKLDPRAAAYLEELTTLARLQAEDLRREDAVRHWSLRIRHVSDLMKLAFELAIALILMAIAAAIGGAIWTAAHDNGLVIEAFSVPPDMAQRGLTGQVVAAQLQDKLVAMQNATDSARAAASYSSNWGSDIKVEIPNTGVSIGEAYRYLAGWLGNETHIGGEVFRNRAGGIAVTARAGADGSATVSGGDGDLDTLLQQVADRIYERTQPYRFAIYVQQQGTKGVAQARAILERLAATGSARDRAWAHMGLGTLILNVDSDEPRTVREYHTALALAPNLALVDVNLDTTETEYGHDEAALAAAEDAVRLFQSGAEIDMSDTARAITAPAEQLDVAFARNDFQAVLGFARTIVTLPDYSNAVENGRETVIQGLALLHDAAGADAAIRDLPPPRSVRDLPGRLATEIISDYWLGKWSAVAALRAPYEDAMAKGMNAVGFSPAAMNAIFAREEWPYAATALAMMGDFKGAHALIDKTPRDCYACVRNRANIDAAEKNWSGANYWFATATRQAPSIPLGWSEWGRMRLAKGDIAGAIALFSRAHDKGPNYADPLVFWGEALMAQNRSDLALAKFEEAAHNAPNWGRLHLKWGEALLWTGDKQGAQQQFKTASTLYLTPAEQSELAHHFPPPR